MPEVKKGELASFHLTCGDCACRMHYSGYCRYAYAVVDKKAPACEKHFVELSDKKGK